MRTGQGRDLFHDREGIQALVKIKTRQRPLDVLRFLQLAPLRSLLLGAVAIVPAFAGAQEPPPSRPHVFVRVTLPSAHVEAVSGRLLVFAAPASGAKAVDLDQMSPAKVFVAAREVGGLGPGETVEVDLDEVAMPKPFSQMARGSYDLQAVLDVRHSYNYVGRAEGDLVSGVVTAELPVSSSAAPLQFSLNETVAAAEDPLAKRPEVDAVLKPIDFVSPVLTRFWGRDIHMRGWVLLPPGYSDASKERYPTVYFTHGFGGTLASLRGRTAPMLFDRMHAGKMPGMIWVLLDESSATGTHEFADSVNNGPWGKALTEELIPHLEAKYRMDARANGRFLQGHSSGGWATLWLQTQYPKIFGGTWSTSPDPSDFHAFSTIDLYAPGANMFHRADGTPQPMLRVNGKPQSSMEELSELEAVLGPYGGQLASFEWVFSPRGPDGRPQQIFDRRSGAIDSSVAAYWRAHYDIDEYLKGNWPRISADLKGKVHLFVGTDDTFYLDGAARRLQATLEQMGGEPHFTFVEGRSHFNVYVTGDDRYALFDRIATEMYGVARPGKAAGPRVAR